MTRRPERVVVNMSVGKWGLLPHTQSSGEYLSTFRLGSVVDVTVQEPKHMGQLALYWSVMRIASQNNDRFIEPKALSNIILLSLGYVEMMELNDGSASLKPMRISDMGHQEFRDFFEAAMVFISTKVMPGADMEKVIKEASKK